jgi:hypothetical protein
MGPFRSFHGVSDVRDATIAAIIDEAARRRPGVPLAEAITPGELVSAASAYYGIVLTPEDAATRIYTHAARSGQ